MTTTDERLRPQSARALWYRDAVSCLQATLATVLRSAGHEPLDALGLHWEFRYLPGDVRTEEFYYPGAVAGDPAASLMPRHPVRSAWHTAPRDDDPLAGPAAELAAGRLVVVAVDNFHLPFRPAFHDVHAAHLLVLHEIHGGDAVVVSDAMPPAFSGRLAMPDFLNAWSSANPDDEQDAFFSDSGIDRRYLTVRVGEPFPVADRALLHDAISSSLTLFRTAREANGAGVAGLPGLDLFLTGLVEAARAGEEETVALAYPFGWGPQAQAALHGEFLRRWAGRHGEPRVAEAGRLVEAVAHTWTGLRVTAAHGRTDPRAAAADLQRHAGRLRRAHDRALDALTEARDSL